MKYYLISKGTRILFLILYCLPIFIVPEFNDMYKKLDVELPFITQLIINYYLFFPVFFFASMLSFSVYKDNKYFNKVFVVNFIVCFLILIGALVALYLPMFALGDVI